MLGSDVVVVHLVQAATLRLGHEADDEAEAADGDGGVQPERAVQAEQLLEVDERLDADEGAGVAEGGGERAAETAVLEREQFADQQPGDGRDAHGEGDGEDEHAEERDPVVLGDAVAVEVLVVRERAERCESDAHEHAAGDEQRQSAHRVDEEAGQQRGEQLDERHRHGAPVRIHPAERLPEDGNCVEVKSVRPGESGKNIA